MLNYGLKIWSSNKKLLKEALALYREGKFHFLELYLVPGSFSSGLSSGLSFNNQCVIFLPRRKNYTLCSEEIKFLKEIPITIHAPHSRHNFNIFDLDEKKKAVFENLVQKTADFFKAKYIVVHAGRGTSQDLFKKNMAKIQDKRILIENMTKMVWNWDGEGNFVKDEVNLCFGYSREQLLFIKEQCGFDICFDFGHAIKSAPSQRIDYRAFIEDLIKELQPTYFHLCDGDTKEERDEHLNLGQGNFDLKWLKKLLLNLGEQQDIDLVLEVPKKGNTLDNDLNNIEYFLSL